MTKVEAMLKDQMETDVFHNVNTDDFGFVDNLVDQTDLDKINDKESDENGCCN